MRTWIKFCGMTSPDDVLAAVEAGADAVGIIVADSPRRVPLPDVARIAAAIPSSIAGVGVVGEDAPAVAPHLAELRLHVQFAGATPPDECRRLAGGRRHLKVLHVAADGTCSSGISSCEPRHYGDAIWLFDTSQEGRLGGTGSPFDWQHVAGVARRHPVAIAGGLTPENVGACVRAVRPFGVDVRTGIERGGRKNPALMRAFVQAVRDADASA